MPNKDCVVKNVITGARLLEYINKLVDCYERSEEPNIELDGRIWCLLHRSPYVGTYESPVTGAYQVKHRPLHKLERYSNLPRITGDWEVCSSVVKQAITGVDGISLSHYFTKQENCQTIISVGGGSFSQDRNDKHTALCLAGSLIQVMQDHMHLITQFEPPDWFSRPGGVTGDVPASGPIVGGFSSVITRGG